MVITYISVYFILSTKSNNVRSNRIIYLQQSTIDYNMFVLEDIGGGCVLGKKEEGNVRSGRDWTGGEEGRRGREGRGSASVKGVRWSSMQAFLRSCSVTRVTVDFFLFFFLIL